MKKLSILGSTGSIGTQTLDIVRANDDLEVVCLAANSNVALILEQIREFHPKLVSLYDEAAAKELKEQLKISGIPEESIPAVETGMEGLLQCATFSEADLVVTAVVGMIGIEPTIAAIRAKKTIALANKETLVSAGHLIMPLAEEMGVRILPVDSEHSAIFQCLEAAHGNPVDQILLTASGGPFRTYTMEQLEKVTVEDALKHPNWNMGAKVTIDSSTMVNKGLEICEACWLFGVTVDQVKVLIQPQSILHSAVEFADGAVIGQLGVPDMHLPIAYALTWPERRPVPQKRLDLAELGSLTFFAPDYEKFRGLKLAVDAIRAGGSMPTVFNAANEVAVRQFLAKEIGYLDIPKKIEQEMNAHQVIAHPSLPEILSIREEIFAHH